MTDELVPFGKYKGQPIEALAADQDYIEWLQAQPWFQARYPNLHTIVINNFREPDETPEHNRLQARFLDDLFQRKTFAALRPRAAADIKGLITRQFDSCLLQIGEHLRKEGEAQERDVRNFDAYSRKGEAELTEEWLTAKTNFESQYKYPYGITWEHYDARHRAEQDRVLQRIDRRKAQIDEVQRLRADFVERALSPAEWLFEVEFESKGIDVTLDVESWAVCPSFFTNGFQSEIRFEDKDLRKWSFKIELKPTLGDDYPAVLRQMRASGSDVLIVGAFNSAAINFEQLEKIFETANCRVLTVAEIDGLLITEAPEA